MNTISKTLRALSLAMFAMAFVFASIPTPTVANEVAAIDNQFVDGNWFAIASAKGEVYKAGSPTNLELEAQLKRYQTAVDENDTEKAEHYAIRSWVKANYAMELGRRALASGQVELAKTHLNRALKLAKTAQGKDAGKGEQGDRLCDDSAPAWRGCSEIEGKRAEARINRLLARANK